MAASPPLSGITVIDLTRVLAGPYCTMLLRDLGAEVIKVEPPQGDEARGFGPFLAEQAPLAEGEEGGGRGESAYFTSLNCGKRSVVLDLKQDAGRAALAGLIRRADVLVENFRPGTLARLGFPPDRLTALNCAPGVRRHQRIRRHRPGRAAARVRHDHPGIVRTDVDHRHRTGAGRRRRGGSGVGTSIADIVSGLYAAVGIVAALAQRAHSGRGAMLDLGMLDATVSVLENAVARYQVTGTVPAPLGTRHPSITPFEAYATADQEIVIAAGNDRLFAALCAVVGRDDLPADRRFGSNAARNEHVAALKRELESALRRHPDAYWLQRLAAAGVPAAPVNTIADLFDDAQIAARGMLLPVAGLDRFLVPGSPLKFAGLTAERQRPPAPKLGEHTRQVLAELAPDC